MSFLDNVLFMNRTNNNDIIPKLPSNLSVSINGTVATFNFTKGANAISTEFIVDGVTKTTDGTSLVVDIGAYSKAFTYKARSKSSTENYSDYTVEATATTDTEKVNIFNSNFLPYDSSMNINGISYSSYATGDTVNKTITHTATGFSSSYAYIFTGFTIGNRYKYLVSLSGSLKGIFIKVICLSSTNMALSNTSELIDETEVTFTIPTGTAKIQIFVGTASGHIDSTTFGNITVEEI